jgi:N-methylhydantoinase B/oxoprolinase/acetone carboxylase alpha subunit
MKDKKWKLLAEKINQAIMQVLKKEEEKNAERISSKVKQKSDKLARKFFKKLDKSKATKKDKITTPAKDLSNKKVKAIIPSKELTAKPPPPASTKAKTKDKAGKKKQ